MIRIFIISLFLFGGVGYIVFQIFRFYLSLQGTKSQRKIDLELLRKEMSDQKQDLINMDDEELKLLSFSEESSHQKSIKGSFVVGHFKSVYNESLFLYGIKEYAATSRSILLISTREYEIMYEITKDKTRVYWNDILFGIIDANGYLLDANEKIKLGKIETSVDAEYQNIFIDNRVIAVMNNPYIDHSSTTRAFSVLNDMDEHDKHICLSLGLLNLVQRNEMKKVY